MSHPYHHALASVKKWGGVPEDYLPIHNWFDESKEMWADFRHRALRHHAEGIFMCEKMFGVTLELSTGVCIPVRWVGEQHVLDDLGRIPSIQDWFSRIVPERWMGSPPKLDVVAELEQQILETTHHPAKRVEPGVCRPDLAAPILATCAATLPIGPAPQLDGSQQVG